MNSEGLNVDVQAKLAEIRAAVEQARSMPMSSSAVVNRTEVLQLLDELRTGIEAAFGDARQLVADRDSIVAEACAESDQILKDARNERENLVSDTEVFRLAQRRAEEIVETARNEAEGLRKEADDYVDSVLATFEITLERTTEEVKRGRDRLAGRSALDSLTTEEADKIVLPEHLDG